jgi:sirohydrochlorin ferrochelatase
MAHGGTEEWNGYVSQAVEPLAKEVPTAVAYGMADPSTLRVALDSLRSQNVGQVAVVRMFLSGESFLDQTNYLLGISETPPQDFVLMGHAAADPMARAPIPHEMIVATHADGLLTSPEGRTIMAQRARALSSTPSLESVLLIAHGMGDEGENERVLEAMDSVADAIRAQGFATVQVASLREDWPGQRAASEAHIRSFVTDEALEGRRVIVLPMRLSGFGPYADVLTGLEYQPGEGLLPHPAVGAWVRGTAAHVICSAGWAAVLNACSSQ